MPLQFEYVYDSDGTCHLFHCANIGVVLAYDPFTPEAAFWFCAEHWTGQDQALLTIVHDLRCTGAGQDSGAVPRDAMCL